MKIRKGWSFFVPLVFTTITVGVLFFLGSARLESPDEAVANEGYKPVFVPDTASFAGERMPLGRFDVKEALDRELLSNSYFHSQTLRFIKLAPRYFTVIEPILKEKGIPADFKYLAVAESGLSTVAVSPARAVGFWQFMKGTALDYGLEINNEVDERYHLEKSTYAACDYLLDSYEKFGSWTMVAASYNRGRNGIGEQIERQKAENYYELLLNSETQRYIFRIMALKLILQDPEKYNFFVEDEEKYPVIKTKEVEVNGKVEDFADFAREHGIDYKLLKNFNPWLRDNFLSNARRKSYTVKIPLLEEQN